MKVILINATAQIDITQLINKVTWSGDDNQVARRLELNITSSPIDDNIPKINISSGNMIIFYDDDNLKLFSGFIFTITKSFNGNTLNVIAYDKSIYLLKSEGAYNFKNTAAENIASTVCRDFDLPVGTFAITGINQNVIFTSESLYEIIMKSYAKASEQNGKKYIMLMIDDNISVIERGDSAIDYTLQNDVDLINSTYSESLENMVNQLIIIDSNQSSFNVIGKVNNPDWIKAFGMFQKVYKKEDGVDATIAAQNLLKGLERKGTIEALGNSSCITGYSVGIKDDYTGLVGVFQIDSDTHTWENGLHTMSLNINFDTVMDETTYHNKKAKTKSTSVSSVITWE